MNCFRRMNEQPISNELARMIEPLASYICATEQPQSALQSALTALFREVEATNRTATACYRNFSVN